LRPETAWLKPRAMIEHISLRCSNSRSSRKFYEKALAPLGYKVDREYGDSYGFIQGGRHDFWVTKGKVGLRSTWRSTPMRHRRSTASTARRSWQEARTMARPECAKSTDMRRSYWIRTGTTSRR